MEVTLNGEPTTLPAQMSVQQLLEQQGLVEKRLAIEINMEIVPRSEFLAHYLHEGDEVEIVHAIGGG